MSQTLMLQGRSWLPEQIQQLRGWVQENPEWSRYHLSRELCRRWQWVRPNGQLADMAARSFLLKLHTRGLIVLPPTRRASPNRMKVTVRRRRRSGEATAGNEFGRDLGLGRN